jgi:3-methyladenine DNA glycosylase/8-oxoguanine DNA glycosylase
VDRKTLIPAPRGTYGFGLDLAYLRSSPSTAHGFQPALDIGPGVVFEVAREKLLPPENPLTLTIWAESLTPALVEVAVAHVRGMLVLNVDGAPIETHLMTRDPALGQYVQHYCGSLPILLGSPWGALLWAVARQLIGVEQARMTKQRLVGQGGRTVMVAGTAWPLPPDPSWVMTHGIDALRAMGLSRTKAHAVYATAEAIQRSTLDLCSALPQTAAAATLAQLETIPGFGPWTTAIVALRGFGHLEVLPDGDAGLQSIVGRHGTPAGRLKRDEFRAWGGRWASYGGLSTYLWWLQLQAEALARRAKAADERRSRG